MHHSPEQDPCICLSRDKVHGKACPRNPHLRPGQATSFEHAEQQHLLSSRSRSRSHPNLLRSGGQEPMKPAMKIFIFSSDPTSFRHHPGHLVPDKALSGLRHRKTVSAVVHPGALTQPLSSTTSRLSQDSFPRSRASWDLLPGEVRNRVYEALLASCSTIIDLHAHRTYHMTVPHERQAYLKLLPGLAYVNRQTYSEFTTFLLEKRTLSVSTLSDLHYLEKVLDGLPGQKGWNSIKSMRFSQFSDLATSPARAREIFDCISRCRNVEKLTLQVKLDLLHMPNDSPAYRQCSFLNGTPGIRSPEQVAANYELSMLFELPNLHKLTMVCRWQREGPVRCTPRTMITFWDLQDWIAHGFATHTRDVKEVIMSLPFNEPKELGAWTIRLERRRKRV